MMKNFFKALMISGSIIVLANMAGAFAQGTGEGAKGDEVSCKLKHTPDHNLTAAETTGDSATQGAPAQAQSANVPTTPPSGTGNAPAGE